MATEAERTQIAVLQNDMQQVKSDISDIKTKQAAGFASIEQKLEAQDRKYASKWVQQVVGGLIALILIAVVTALLALVIIPATKKEPNASSSTPASGSSVSSPSSGAGSATTPSATASANSHSDTATPDSSQTSQSNPAGGVTVTLPKGL